MWIHVGLVSISVGSASTSSEWAALDCAAPGSVCYGRRFRLRWDWSIGQTPSPLSLDQVKGGSHTEVHPRDLHLFDLCRPSSLSSEGGRDDCSDATGCDPDGDIRCQAKRAAT